LAGGFYDQASSLFRKTLEGIPAFFAAFGGSRRRLRRRPIARELSDADFRNLARLVSACTLGLWAFAAGLLIGTFLFS